MFNLFLAGTLFYNLHNLASIGTTSSHTEIITNVNGQETKVVSDEPGTVKVTNINGETTIEKSENIIKVFPATTVSPSAIASPKIHFSSPEIQINTEPYSSPILKVFTRIINAIRDFIIGT